MGRPAEPIVLGFLNGVGADAGINVVRIADLKAKHGQIVVQHITRRPRAFAPLPVVLDFIEQIDNGAYSEEPLKCADVVTIFLL